MFIPSGVSGLSHPALRPQFGPNALLCMFVHDTNNNIIPLKADIHEHTIDDTQQQMKMLSHPK